jgi:hypothetical protein
VDAQFAEVEEVKGWKMAGGRPFISEKEKLRLQARSAVAWQAQLFDHRRQVRACHHETKVQECDTFKDHSIGQSQYRKNCFLA